MTQNSKRGVGKFHQPTENFQKAVGSLPAYKTTKLMIIKFALWLLPSSLIACVIYNQYLQHTAPAVLTKAESVQLEIRCEEYNLLTELTTSKKKEIEAFVNDVKTRLPKIAKDEVIISSLSNTTDGKTTYSETTKDLKICVNNLTKHLENAAK